MESIRACSEKSGDPEALGSVVRIAGAPPLCPISPEDSGTSELLPPGTGKSRGLLRDGHWSIVTMPRVLGPMTYTLNAHESPLSPLAYDALRRQCSWILLSQLQPKDTPL